MQDHRIDAVQSAHLAVVPEPPAVDYAREHDEFWRAIADAAEQAITKVSPENPELARIRTFMLKSRSAAGMPNATPLA